MESCVGKSKAWVVFAPPWSSESFTSEKRTIGNRQNVFLAYIGGGVAASYCRAANDWEVKAGDWRLVTSVVR